MMTLSEKINHYRRLVMRKMSRVAVVTNHRFNEVPDLQLISKILICRPNHRLGNLLLMTPLLQELEEKFPDAELHLFVRGNLATALFRNYPQVKRLIMLPGKPFDNLLLYFRKWASLRRHKYDLVINVDPNSFSGRLATKFSRGSVKFSGSFPEDESLFVQSDHLAKKPVNALRIFLRNFGLGLDRQDVPYLDLRLSTHEKMLGKTKLLELTGNDFPTICIFTYATGAKRYHEGWWKEFNNCLGKEFPQFNIVEILPKENVSQIAFAAPVFYSTDLREIASVIACTEVFIGADSGMMHLASASRCPVMGLFSVTDPRRYGPYNDGSLSIDTNIYDIKDCICALSGLLAKLRISSARSPKEEEAQALPRTRVRSRLPYHT